jgi:hypothetical protein
MQVVYAMHAMLINRIEFDFFDFCGMSSVVIRVPTLPYRNVSRKEWPALGQFLHFNAYNWC